MGLCASGDIFQAKVYELIGDIGCIMTYIDDILVLDKGIFSRHIDQIRVIFASLRAAGLKVNAPKCSFGLMVIPCLGYIII